LGKYRQDTRFSDIHQRYQLKMGKKVCPTLRSFSGPYAIMLLLANCSRQSSPRLPTQKTKCRKAVKNNVDNIRHVVVGTKRDALLEKGLELDAPTRHGGSAKITMPMRNSIGEAVCSEVYVETYGKLQTGNRYGKLLIAAAHFVIHKLNLSISTLEKIHEHCS
jgi:hypothetical protein